MQSTLSLTFIIIYNISFLILKWKLFFSDWLCHFNDDVLMLVKHKIRKIVTYYKTTGDVTCCPMECYQWYYTVMNPWSLIRDYDSDLPVISKTLPYITLRNSMMQTSEAKFQMKFFKNLVRYEKTSNSLLNNTKMYQSYNRATVKRSFSVITEY